MLSGTQPIVSLSLAEIGIDITLRADLRIIREKAIRMTSLFIELVEARCAGHDIRLASPRDASVRGSQVSFHHPNGYPIVRALHDRGVICDYRSPGNMRFGFAPLYNSYAEVWDAVDQLTVILEQAVWKQAQYQERLKVT